MLVIVMVSEWATVLLMPHRTQPAYVQAFIQPFAQERPPHTARVLFARMELSRTIAAAAAR
jgi:hypothetical protein